MNWVLIAELIYGLFIAFVCLRIIFDTRSSAKASAYILLVVLLPLVGAFVYFSVGVNYRKRKLYSKNLFGGELKQQVLSFIQKDRNRIINAGSPVLARYSGLVDMMLNQSFCPLSDDNQVELLINGEQKFPAVQEAIENARHHIHFEYYIFTPDGIGMQLIEQLMRKAREGVKVRFIYDDFGSYKIRKKLKQMRAAGIEVYPFYRIRLLLLANRLNYRNHRKIIVVDGELGFVGGINVSDRYINNPADSHRRYWRDTHLKLSGTAVQTLQYIFMVDWNFCSRQKLLPDRHFFPKHPGGSLGRTVAQVVASGPDSDSPLILQALCKAISLAKKEVLITNPYFIPNVTLMDTILISALSGVRVKLLVPGDSDSRLVNMVCRSYFTELLQAGVEIYTYTRGFVHAKTIVIDGELAIVGTANMDNRSFDLNFEVNAMLYDCELAAALRRIFYEDLADSTAVDKDRWSKRPVYRQLADGVVRLVSPLM